VVDLARQTGEEMGCRGGANGTVVDLDRRQQWLD